MSGLVLKDCLWAGIAFIFPAVFITGILAWLYVEYGTLPAVEPFIFGIKPAVLAIIAGAVIKLGKKALKSWELGVLGALVIVACYFGVNEVSALLGAGLLGAFFFYVKHQSAKDVKSVLPIMVMQATGSAALKITAAKVFWTFLKVGAVLYGSGYVLFAYLDAELVEAGWMTRQELLDAIAVGQFTPGPVLSTSTFIGYQLSGFWGAIAATTGIFLPSFLFVLLLNPLVPRMRKSKFLSFFLDSVNVAAVAVMLWVLFVMTKETIFPELKFDWRAGIIAAASVFVTFRLKKVNVMWTILGGAFLGYLLGLI